MLTLDSVIIRVFVLVFFDDILIFSDSWSAHLQHVTVAYLGHVISTEGVAMDTNKVEAVRAWPTPRIV
jgi:hypothetical protein